MPRIRGPGTSSESTVEGRDHDHPRPGWSRQDDLRAVAARTNRGRPIRTDVERKRLHGLVALSSSGSKVGAGLYTEEATRQTYRHVSDLARTVAQAGYRAVVDGAFLQRWQREMLRETAAALGVPFVIMTLSVPEATLRERIVERRQRGADASEATIEVLDAQLRAYEPLDSEEQRFVVSWENAGSWKE